MTNDQIIAWAKECELSRYVQVEKTVVVNVLAAFAALVAAHEREQCARVCDAESKYWYELGAADQVESAELCAKAIRARTE